MYIHSTNRGKWFKSAAASFESILNQIASNFNEIKARITLYMNYKAIPSIKLGAKH